MDSDYEPRQQHQGPKGWETIADRLHAAGWSYGVSTQRTKAGALIHCIDAHRDGGGRFIVHSDELLTAFAELERQTREI